MKLEQATRHVLGFDTAAYVDPTTAKRFREELQCTFVIRYLRRDQHVNEQPDISGKLWTPADGIQSLSRQELDGLLWADLRVGVVQFGRWHGRNYLTPETGKQLGYNQVHNRRLLGLPEGMTIWLSGEWTDDPGWSRVGPFLRAEAQQVAELSDRPGQYMAYDRPTGPQWYSLPYVRAYWGAAMQGVQERDPWPRGCLMTQSRQYSDWDDNKTRSNVYGIPIDYNLTSYDRRGGSWYWAAP
jgi:hypothetical protein